MSKELKSNLILNVASSISLVAPDATIRFTAAVEIVLRRGDVSQTITSGVLEALSPKELEKQIEQIKSQLEELSRSPGFTEKLGMMEIYEFSLK